MSIDLNFALLTAVADDIEAHPETLDMAPRSLGGDCLLPQSGGARKMSDQITPETLQNLEDADNLTRQILDYLHQKSVSPEVGIVALIQAVGAATVQMERDTGRELMTETVESLTECIAEYRQATLAGGRS